MDRFAHYDWPFFDERHAKLAREADAWAHDNLAHAHGDDADAICKRLVQDLGCAGYLHHCVIGAPRRALDRAAARGLRLPRRARRFRLRHGRVWASGPIALAGTDAQKKRYLRRAAAGEAIAAFALSEPDAGSDVQAMKTRARRAGRRLGARRRPRPGSRTAASPTSTSSSPRPEEGISAFIVDAEEVDASERIDIVAPHPMATREAQGARAELLGEAGQGFKLAMRNLDIFRTTVAGAALGFARRALDEALARARGRKMFGQTLADFQMTQAKLADMATGDRRRGAAHLSRRRGRRTCGSRARDPRGGDGEDVRHRGGAAA